MENGRGADGSSSEFPEADALIRRAQWMWRGCLLLPFIYLGIAFLLNHFWFVPHRFGAGLWPMRSESFNVLLGVFGALAAGSQAAHYVYRKRFNERIARERLKPMAAAKLYWKRTIYLVCCADLVSGLGLVAFLLNAHWNALIAFCLISYLLYIQSYPRGFGG